VVLESERVENDEIRMTNDERTTNDRMTKDQAQRARAFPHSVIRHLDIDSPFGLRHSSFIAAFLAGILLLTLSGCEKKQSASVVLYTSVDQPVARPIIQAFEKRTGIKVVLQTDTEATKSAGLAERLEAERDNPQADVWWGNEIFHTINLAERGVLASYESPAMARIPALYKDPQHRWAGTALRARVLARTTAGAGEQATRRIDSIVDLTRSSLKGKICMARPTAGTTGGHVAALYTLWGPEKTEQFLRYLKDNGIALLGGNSVVAEYVGQGQMWIGLTDNDDVDSAIREGGKEEPVLPDQGPDEIGTLTIPCTVALVQGAKNTEAARKLVDYLLSLEVEKMLLDARFARYSVFAEAGERKVKAMAIDYRAVARNMKPAVEMAMRVLEGRQ
jgi:iron(III) transport system substrate-binding protein